MNQAIFVPRKPAVLTEDCCDRCRHVREDYSTGQPQFFCRRFPPVPFPVIVMTPNGPTHAERVIGAVRMVPRQVGDLVRDPVTGEAGDVTADSVIWLGRLGEMHATQEMIDRIKAEVDRRGDRKVIPLGLPATP